MPIKCFAAASTPVILLSRSIAANSTRAASGSPSSTASPNALTIRRICSAIHALIRLCSETSPPSWRIRLSMMLRHRSAAQVVPRSVLTRSGMSSIGIPFRHSLTTSCCCATRCFLVRFLTVEGGVSRGVFFCGVFFLGLGLFAAAI